MRKTLMLRPYIIGVEEYYYYIKKAIFNSITRKFKKNTHGKRPIFWEATFHCFTPLCKKYSSKVKGDFFQQR